MADIFLYGGAPSLNDIILRDPSKLDIIIVPDTPPLAIFGGGRKRTKAERLRAIEIEREQERAQVARKHDFKKTLTDLLWPPKVKPKRVSVEEPMLAAKLVANAHARQRRYDDALATLLLTSL